MNRKPFTFEELRAIVAMLRSEHGCPWDKAQTHTSIRQHLLEEAYEVNQAASDLEATGNPDHLIEELGDLLFQILLQAQIAEEKGEFTIDHITDHVAKKMIHRHPHVFGGKKYENADQQTADWEKLKNEESGHVTDSLTEELDAVAAVFPALLRAQKFAKKTTRRGMFSADSQDIFHDIISGIAGLYTTDPDEESRHTPDQDRHRLLGRTLFAICRYAEANHLSAEMALLDTLDEIKAQAPD